MSDLRVIKGEETYRKIIEAAIDIISGEGVSGLRAGKVALRAGVSKSTVFYHFESIDELAMVVLDTLIVEVMAPMKTIKVGSVEMIFNTLETMFFGRMEENPRLNKVFYAFYYAGMFDEAYEEVMHTFLQVMKEKLACKMMNVSVRGIKRSEATRYATLILSMLDGIGRQLLLGENQEHYINSWRLLKQVIVRELNNHEDSR